jgi:hypothetical protein
MGLILLALQIFDSRSGVGETRYGGDHALGRALSSSCPGVSVHMTFLSSPSPGSHLIIVDSIGEFVELE